MTRLVELALSARQLADSLANDVALCANREEHIRLTARLNEAEHLFLALDALISREDTAA